MTQNHNKNITHITYNHLNLPKKISFQNNNYIEYTYDASGVKLKKKVTENNTVSVTDYLDGFQYNNSKLQFFPHAEGYVKHTLVGGNNDISIFKYVYQYKDHLGNVRVNYTLAKGSLVILDEHHYYPFGLEHGSYNPTRKEYRKAEDGGNNDIVVITEVENSGYQYKYNGKELQDELGLDWYDYGARNYDAALGRFMNIDPLADKYIGLSPYSFAANSPILLTDPDGRDIIFSWQRDKNNNIIGVNISVTGKIIDNTKNGLSKRRLNMLRNRIIKGLTTKIKSYDDNFNVNVTANIGVAESESELKETDHAFRIVDNVDTAIGRANDPNKKTLGSSKAGENYVYLSKDFTKRTVAHEVGHSAGLDHIKVERKNGKYGKPIDYWGFSSTGKRHYRRYTPSFYPGNLMHQQSDPSPGSKLVRWQFNKMLEKYKNNELNKGKQK